MAHHVVSQKRIDRWTRSDLFMDESIRKVCNLQKLSEQVTEIINFGNADSHKGYSF